MTVTRIAARPEKDSQGLWISMSCGVSVRSLIRRVAHNDGDTGHPPPSLVFG